MDYANKKVRFHQIKRFTRLCLLVVVLYGVCSCNYEFPDIPEEPQTSLQDADLSNTFFIGSSPFSGVTDGVLIPKTSLKSIPQIFLNNLAASQEILDFSATSENQIGFNIYENQSLNEDIGPYELKYPASADSTFFQEASPGEPFLYKSRNESLQNYSFPKAQLLDFTEANRSTNLFVNDYLSDVSSPLIDVIIAESPSFFVLNMGYDDLLGYAINGAEGSINVPDAINHSYADMLDPAFFEQKLQSMVNSLLASSPNTKGALFNIPDFLKFPFFTKIKYDITPFICAPNTLNTSCSPTEKYHPTRAASLLFNQKQLDYYSQNPGIPFQDRRLGIHYDLDSPFTWGILVEDKNLPDITINGETLPRIRQMVRNEMVFYPNESFLGDSRGSLPTNAIPENQYLRLNEIEFIRNQINVYNQAINNIIAQSNGDIVLIDINTYYEDLFQGLDSFLDLAADGTLLDGAPFLPILGKFGIFSADGLNLNPRGNALIVNHLIDALNLGFNGNLNKVNPNDFAGTSFVIDNN